MAEGGAVEAGTSEGDVGWRGRALWPPATRDAAPPGRRTASAVEMPHRLRCREGGLGDAAPAPHRSGCGDCDLLMMHLSQPVIRRRRRWCGVGRGGGVA
jgi:hypothetical protein